MNYLSVFDHFVGLALKGLKGDSCGFRRRKNLEQFIVFKQNKFVNVFVFFSYFEILPDQLLRLKKLHQETFLQSTTLNNKPAFTLPSM